MTDYATGRERSTWRYVAETKWSPTDAALAYYLTKSSKNERYKAHYNRVRIAQKLVATVDISYYRLLALQKNLASAQELVALRSAMADTRKRQVGAKISGYDEYESANQRLMRARRFLAKVQNQIEKEKNTLASAMGVSPHQSQKRGFHVIGALTAPGFKADASEMEMRAVQNRPEAFEAGLNHLNSINDLQRSLIKSYPKVSFFWRYNYDKDKFLLRKDWTEVGLYVYCDLLEWVTGMQQSNAAKLDAQATERKTAMVALGIASQVRVAALEYAETLVEIQSAEASLKTSEEAFRAAGQKRPKDELEKLALADLKAYMLEDTIARDRAMGEANAALAELQGAMGINYSEPPPTTLAMAACQ